MLKVVTTAQEIFANFSQNYKIHFLHSQPNFFSKDLEIQVVSIEQGEQLHLDF